MRRDEAIRIIGEHAEELRSRGVTAVYLFGSTARDEAGPGSDVDILVDIDPQRNFTLLKLVGLQLYFEKALGCRVDVGTARGLKPQFQEQVHREMIRAA